MKGSLLQIQSFVEKGEIDLRNGDLKGNKLHKFFKQLRIILAKLNSQFNFVNQSCLNYKNELYRLYQEFKKSGKDSPTFHSTTNNYSSNTNNNQYIQRSKQPYLQKTEEQYGLHLPVNSRSGQSRQNKRDLQDSTNKLNYYQNRNSDRDPSPVRSRSSKNNTKSIQYGFGQYQNPFIQKKTPYFQTKKNDTVRQSRFSNKRNRLLSADKGLQRHFGNSSKQRGSATWKLSPARPFTHLFSNTRKTGIQNYDQMGQAGCTHKKNFKNQSPINQCSCQVNDVVNQVRQIKNKIDQMQDYCKKSMINGNQPKNSRQTRKKVTKVYGLNRQKTAQQLQSLKKQMDGYIDSIISSKRKAMDYLDKNIKKIRERQEKLPALGRLTNDQYIMQKD